MATTIEEQIPRLSQFMPTSRIQPQPGQESVWDYPRPPRLEPSTDHVQVIHHQVVIADSDRSYRVLETSHPPVYCIPPEDIQMQYLSRSSRRSLCEFKGVASYWSLQVNDQKVADVAWSYEDPTPAFAAIRGFLSFYASKVDQCWVNGELVQSQSGDFYGGWITSRVVGPFKGGPGTWGW